MKTNDAFNAIAELDLEPIKTKLMHAASGEGWSQAKADAMETEYRRFLYLMHAFPNEETAPTVDVDTFWHYHILDTMKYAADCEKAFGYFLHHCPYLGMQGEQDAGAEERGGDRMRELYEQTFGEAYIRPEAYGASAAKAAYCMIQPTEAAKAAYCMIRPTQGAKAAYCMIRPTEGAKAAYCMIQPTEGAKAAYCMIQPTEGAKAAYRMIQPTEAAKAAEGASAAYCMIQPTEGAKVVEGAKAAYCMIQPTEAATAAAGATAAYCMIQPTEGAKAVFGAVGRASLGSSPVLPAFRQLQAA